MIRSLTSRLTFNQTQGLRITTSHSSQLLRSSLVLVPSRLNQRSTSIRTLWGFSFPVASNEPLAGTIDGSGPPFLFILQVFLGLPTILWIYKCLILIIFQRKIIYLPSVPPGTRNESLNPPTSERLGQLNGLDWKEIEVESTTKTRWTRQSVILKGLELTVSTKKKEGVNSSEKAKEPDIVIIYLQGNAGTPLMSIPLFRKILLPTSSSSPSLKIVTIAPRSYWISTRSAPTQSTLLSDYTSFLFQTISSHSSSTKFILYGHSLGGSIALHLLHHHPQILSKRINGIILENPLPSIPYMVQSLYPQKWLPYHYLGPFSFDRWDSISLLKLNPNLLLSSVKNQKRKVLFIRSQWDEIVPNDEEETGGSGGVKEMYNLIDEEKVDKKWVEIERALHDTAYLDPKWKKEIKEFIEKVGCSN